MRNAQTIDQLRMSQRQPDLPASGANLSASPSGTDTVFASIFDFFGTLDRDGRALQLAGSIFDRTNTDPSLLVGQRFAETVFWQSSEHTSRLLEQAIENAKSGQASDTLLDFRVSADEKIPMEVSLRRLPSGEIFCGGKSVADRAMVDAYKAESDQLLLAAENAEIGLWYWDFAQEKIYSTPRCNELLGLPAYEPLSRERFLGVVHHDDLADASEFLERSRQEGTRYAEEFRVVYPDRSVDWLRAEGKSFVGPDGEPQRMMGSLRKVTEQKLAAEELELVYEREKKARDEAEVANRAKDFFLAFVSHELRSPLNAILGWVKILLTKEVDEKTRRNALETIERSARSQGKLINDLVDSSRVASGKIRLEYLPTNLVEVVRVSFDAQRPAAESHHIDLKFETEKKEAIVIGDAGRLQQVFTNLISNAIKFTPSGGTVTVTLSASDEIAQVSVKDSGQGISAETLPHIFQQFSQGDIDRERNNAGLGLGLSIVKILVARHGGEVRAESEGPGLGSEFVVTLPVSQGRPDTTESGSPAAEERSERVLQGLRVLIVEDDPDSREVLQLCLEQSGADVLAAGSAVQAFELLDRNPAALPNVMISDLAMPNEDGYTLMSRIRELPREKGGGIPAMALSAFANAESRSKAFRSGFQRYATKPFDPDKLILDIAELARESELVTETRH